MSDPNKKNKGAVEATARKIETGKQLGIGGGVHSRLTLDYPSVRRGVTPLGRGARVAARVTSPMRKGKAAVEMPVRKAQVGKHIGTGGVVHSRTTMDYSPVQRAVQPLGGGAGGAGAAAKFHDNGGPVLPNARVQLVFWGRSWGNTPAPTPSATQVGTALINMINSPYLSALSQYRSNIGQASLRGTTLFTNSNPPNSFTDQNVINMLIGLLNNGSLPNPLFETVLYMVIMPQGVASSNASFVGEHTFFSYNAQLPGLGIRIPVPVHFAWVTNNGTLDSVTTIASHELVESITDPEGSAILGNAGVCSQGGWCEIGDVCYTTGRLNGVAVQSYWSDIDGACIVPDGMVAGPVMGNPAMVQSRFGRKGNFELVVPLPANGLAHYWRNNDDPFLAWHGPYAFGARSGQYSAVTMIESNYGSPGNLEVVAIQGSNLIFFWRDSGPAFNWNGPFRIGSGVAGVPALIQSRFGHQGNFELAMPDSRAGIKFYWRNNDLASKPWSAPIMFGKSLGRVDAVSMIQSNYGNPGNLELMALASGNLYFFWRDSGPAFHWQGPFHIASGVSGDVALIQSRFGHKGNFEMVAPLANGLAHYWRNNDNPSMPWSPPIPFATGVGHVDSLTMIQSNFGSPGNLEVEARIGSRLALFWRDSGPALHWNGPIWTTR